MKTETVKTETVKETETAKETEPVKESLLDPEEHSGERDVFSDEHVRISLAMKKMGEKQVNILLRYYAAEDPLEELEFAVRGWRRGDE